MIYLPSNKVKFYGTNLSHFTTNRCQTCTDFSRAGITGSEVSAPFTKVGLMMYIMEWTFDTICPTHCPFPLQAMFKTTLLFPLFPIQSCIMSPEVLHLLVGEKQSDIDVIPSYGHDSTKKNMVSKGGNIAVYERKEIAKRKSCNCAYLNF